MLIEKVEKLLEIVLAVLVIEIDNEGNRSDIEDLYFFCLAVEDQVANEIILGTDLLVTLEVIYHSLLVI